MMIYAVFFSNKYKIEDNIIPYFVKKSSSDIRCFQRLGIRQQQLVIDKGPPTVDSNNTPSFCYGLDRAFLLSKARGRKDDIFEGFTNTVREAGRKRWDLIRDNNLPEFHRNNGIIMNKNSNECIYTLHERSSKCDDIMSNFFFDLLVALAQ